MSIHKEQNAKKLFTVHYNWMSGVDTEGPGMGQAAANASVAECGNVNLDRKWDCPDRLCAESVCIIDPLPGLSNVRIGCPRRPHNLHNPDASHRGPS